MKFFHSLKSHPRTATAFGIAIVAAVLLAVPISYTRITGYRATLEIAEASGVDIQAVAAEFGKALGTDDLTVRTSAGGMEISAVVPARAAGRTYGIASGFAGALTQRGIPATAGVEALTERVTGNVYAMAANEIVEIRIDSGGLSDEEIEAEIRDQIEAAGLEACLVDVQSGDGEKRIEIGIGQGMDGTPTPIKITIDGMEPPPGAECISERCMELRIAKAGRSLEEAESLARQQLEAMGVDVSGMQIDDCGDYYRVHVGDVPGGCCSDGGGESLLGSPPRTESKTLGEIKREFTD